MPHYKAEYFSGDVYECEIYFSLRERGRPIPRGKNTNLSSKEQQEINTRQARKKLIRLINANFGPGDCFITLTYAREPPDMAQAAKDLKNYLRRVRYYQKKQGLPELKYIAVTEAETERVHHHVILSSMSADTAIRLWSVKDGVPIGRVLFSRLDPGAEYTGLALYITKEQRGGRKKRWSQSRNLKRPKVRVKEIKSPAKLLRPPKGYKVVVQDLYATEAGQVQYLRAIRAGGMDYATGRGKGVVKDDL